MNLEPYFTEFQEIFMPEEFQWRKGQKEAIEQIVEAYHSKQYNTVILDAPVGSGKSLIAMCSSWILNQEGHKGYVLSSEISLQDQYEKDLHEFRLDWGSIKGLDNYECIDNFEKTSMGTCKIMGKEARKMPCYSECPYYVARDKASSSHTSMLNYAYWLAMMNEVNPRMDEAKQIFPKRDFTFCDEAHKILDIIQSTYSPKFSEKQAERIERLVEFFEVHKMGDYYDEFHPAVMRSIAHIIKKARKKEKLNGICGEFAGNRLALPFFIGLKVGELSMTPASVPQIKNMIRQIDSRDAENLVNEILRIPTTEGIKSRLSQFLTERDLIK